MGFAPLAISFEEFSDENGPFDLIIMSQVLEHVLDIDLWVEKAARLLNPGGVLAVAVPNFASIFRLIQGIGDPHINPPSHINYFSPYNLEMLLIRHGLVVGARQWVSRLSPESLKRRLAFLGPLGGLVPSSFIFRVVDRAHLGMYFNLYGVK